MADVIERLERQATDQRRVTHDDHDLLIRAALLARQRQALGDRQPGTGVAAVEDVMLALATAREATHATELAEGVELVEPSGQQLVRVSLMAGVPDELVGRAVEQPVERDGQLDHAERAAQVAAGAGHGPDDRSAQLGAQLTQLDVAQLPEVAGAFNARQEGQERLR